MSNYLITLTPIDKFFFGGETTFLRGSGGNTNDRTAEYAELKKFDRVYGSYIVKSNLFPQQTSLLGMLRFLILSNNENLFADNKIKQGKHGEAAELIGKQSFNLNGDTCKEMDFKSIQRLFPCFIQRKAENDDRWSDLTVAPMNFVRRNKDKDLERDVIPLEVSFQSRNTFMGRTNHKAPVIEHYKSKIGIQTFLFDGKTGWKTSEIFKEDARIGIDRDFKGKTKPDAYYKQIFYRFTDNYKDAENENGEARYRPHMLRFAFYAEMTDVFQPDKNYIVSLGGDNSRFSLHAEKVDEIREPTLPDDGHLASGFASITLTTEAMIAPDALNHCLFSINETVPFRFLTSTVHTEKYSKFAGDNRLKRNEKKYNLYKRGSIFYFDLNEAGNEDGFEKFKEAIDGNQLLRQIGYNYYKTTIKR